MTKLGGRTVTMFLKKVTILLTKTNFTPLQPSSLTTNG